MSRLAFALVLVATLPAALAACADDDRGPPTTLPDDLLPLEPAAPDGVLPWGAGIRFVGPVAPGGVTFVDAPTYADDLADRGTGVADLPFEPDAPLSVSGGTWVSVLLASETEWLEADHVFFELEASYDDPDAASPLVEVHVTMPATDLAIGEHALDGKRIVAWAGRRDTAMPISGVTLGAVSGALTITAGGDGAAYQASLAAEFGPIEILPWELGPGPLDGSYLLAFEAAAEARCEGTLDGAEDAFAQLALLDLGFGAGVVELDVLDDDLATISGPPIAAGFATAELRLDHEQSEAYVAEVVELPGPGPAGSERFGHFFALDLAGASQSLVLGTAGAIYQTADAEGVCFVSFPVTMTRAL